METSHSRHPTERGTMQITQQMIDALQNLRDLSKTLNGPVGICVRQSVDALDNAGIFKAIDEHTGYDVSPEPFLPIGDPSEYGDLVARVSIVNDDEHLTVGCTQHGELFRGGDTFENRANAHEVKALHNGLHVDRAGRKSTQYDGKAHGHGVVYG